MPHQYTEEDVFITVLHDGKRFSYAGLVKTRRGTRKVRVLVDNGATKSMVSVELSHELRRTEVPGRVVRFHFGNGTVYRSTKICPDVMLDIGDFKITRDLPVCELAQYDVILGQDWLADVCPDVHWQTGDISIDDSKSAQRAAIAAEECATDNTARQTAGTATTRNVRVEVVSASAMRRTLRKGGVDAAVFVAKAAQEHGHNDDKATTTPGVTQGCDPAVAEVVQGFKDRFGAPAGLPPKRPGYDHKISLVPEARPPYRPPFRLSEDESSELAKQLEGFLQKEYIRPSNSPYGAPVLFAKKKDGTLRLCVDYRALNKLTVRDRYPLPNIADMLDKLGEACVFSKLDLRAGYHQVRVHEDDIHKTAFVTHLGSFEWRVLPMGLTNAPPTLQRIMDKVLRAFRGFVLVYLDDVLIFSKSTEEHAQHVRQVLAALRENGLYLHPDKCVFGVDTVTFLGHTISAGKITMEHDKISAIKTWPKPSTMKQLQSFLGFANFYRRFIRRYADTVEPLIALTRDTKPRAQLVWTAAAEKAFEAIKETMCASPSLHMVQAGRPYVLYTDASDCAVGAALHQLTPDGEEVPVAFLSRALSATERRDPVRDRELLAGVTAA